MSEHLYLIVRRMKWLSLWLEDMTVCMFGNPMKVNSMQDWNIICFHQICFEFLTYIRCPNLMNLSHVAYPPKPGLIDRRLKSFKFNTKELSLCHKLWIYNPYIFRIQCRKSLIFQTYIIWYYRIHSLKYLRSTTLESKDIGL